MSGRYQHMFKAHTIPSVYDHDVAVVIFANRVIYSVFFLMLIVCRKTCQACKCTRDTHAIYQEQVTSVRERLGFKPDMHTSKIDPRHVGYTWVPPGIMTSSKVFSD